MDKKEEKGEENIGETPNTPIGVIKKNDKIQEEARKILSYGHMDERKTEILKEYEELKRREEKLYNEKMKLKKQIREQMNLGRRLLYSKEIEHEEKEKVRNVMKTFKGYSRSLVNPGGTFMKMFLGKVNDCVLTGGLNRKYAFKQEYEGMKYQFTIVNFFITIMLCFCHIPVLDTVFRVLLLYYYTAISLREEILRVNGSNIKLWWRLHHYTTILICIVSISWPETDIYWMFRTQFVFTNLYGCFLQFLQYKYQMKRLYILKSLGKARELDTVNAESASQGIFLKVLVPFIVLDIGLVSWNTTRLLWRCVREGAEWQAYMTGFFFLFLCVGNSYSLIVVCSKKIPFFRRLKERLFPGKKRK